jgi:hypothetical protein
VNRRGSQRLLHPERRHSNPRRVERQYEKHARCQTVNSEVTGGRLMVLGQLSVGEPVGNWTAVIISTIPDVLKV